MNLYYWSSEALGNYALGDIVVMAEDVTEARRLAKQQSRKQYENSPWVIKAIAVDLEKEPEVIRSGVFFRGGSA